jgi:hypothetical protein
VIASDAPLGLTPSLVLVDELHAHRDGELYEAMRTSMLKRPGARLVTISTAGADPDGVLGRLRARALPKPDVTRSGALTRLRAVSGHAGVGGRRRLERREPRAGEGAEPGVVDHRGRAGRAARSGRRRRVSGGSTATSGQLTSSTGCRSGRGAKCADPTVRIHPGERIFALTHSIAELSFDPWRFEAPALELAERGIPVVVFPQSNARMSPASERLHAAIV